MRPQHTLCAVENEVDALLLFDAPLTGASFQLGAWGPTAVENDKRYRCPPHSDDEYKSSDDDGSWSSCGLDDNDLRKSTTLNDKTKCSSLEPDENLLCCSPRRVRFSEITQVRFVTSTLPEDWSRLYYSGHEIQKMMDDHRAELNKEEEAAQTKSTATLQAEV